MNWSQLHTLLWLRWRLTLNQWSRRGQLNAALTMIAVLLGVVVGIGAGIGGIAAGALTLAKAPPLVMLVVWDVVVGVFLFVWLMGVVTEIQRSETIDMSRLLHLPISPKEAFLINYLASHLTLSLAVAFPAMLGLAAGLVVGKGGAMLWMFPSVVGFIFMITAWTHCLRGWLVSLMVNQRRRRAIIVGITMGAMLLAQLPNAFNLMRDHRRGPPPANQSASGQAMSANGITHGKPLDLPAWAILAHQCVPPLWVANGAMHLVEGSSWPAFLGALGTFSLGGLGLRRAYRSTLRFYQGEFTGQAAQKKRTAASPSKGGKILLDWTLPGIPEEAAVMALAAFRSLTRAPEVKMALVSNVVVLGFLGLMFFSRRNAAPSAEILPFLATGTVALTFFSSAQLMCNLFGFDREGFRSLVLLPADRRHFLLGKNLALLPFTIGLGLVYLVLLEFVTRLPLLLLLASVIQLATSFSLLSILGNLISVLVPHRVSPGSLKPTKAPAKTTLLLLVFNLLFPIVMLPVFLAPLAGYLAGSSAGWPPVFVNLALSGALAFLAALLYWRSLGWLGRLLSRREREILEVVTQEVE